MRLMDLIANLPISPEAGPLPEIRGITHDSRQVEAGDLFVELQIVVPKTIDDTARKLAEQFAEAAPVPNLRQEVVW